MIGSIAAVFGETGIAIWVAILALAGTAITGVLTYIGKHGDTQVMYDANLRDDQLAFITEMRASNQELREDNRSLTAEVRRCAARISKLERVIREAGLPVPNGE